MTRTSQNYRDEKEHWADIKEQRRPSLGQARLSEHEMGRFRLGNQYTDRLTLIELQCIKAAAMYYEVSDWTSKVDRTLTYEENIELMRQRGTYGSDAGKSMRQLTHLL